MEIKNKNIFLNLNEGEKIVYLAEKDKSNFWWNFIFLTFIGLPLIGLSIILFILLLLLPFFMYAEYKLRLSDNQNKSYKSTKHHHNAKEPYFETYMSNLQDKIKSNWNPPKGKESSNVVLLFKVDRNGNVLKAKVLKSSNITAIDDSALEALKKSEPLEPLPKEFKGKDIDVQFNFDYNVLSHKR